MFWAIPLGKIDYNPRNDCGNHINFGSIFQMKIFNVFISVRTTGLNCTTYFSQIRRSFSHCILCSLEQCFLILLLWDCFTFGLDHRLSRSFQCRGVLGPTWIVLHFLLTVCFMSYSIQLRYWNNMLLRLKDNDILLFKIFRLKFCAS